MRDIVFRGLAVAVIAMVPGITTQILIGNAEADCPEVSLPGATAPAATPQGSQDQEGCR